MKWLRLVAGFPFGILYGCIMQFRRWLYEQGWLQRHKAAIPVIVAGNLTVGGTGKTPFVIWLTGALSSRKPAVLSRGYGRKSSGFAEVTLASAVEDTGDEPAEMKLIFGETFRNFVCENRPEGIANIRIAAPDTGLVIMDDGYQHLRLLPDAAVLLCDYNRPFYADWPMPAGRLREFAGNARFATCIVVTKCPDDLDVSRAMAVRQKLARYGKPVFFAAYRNTPALNASGTEAARDALLVAVSGLADPLLFEQWVRRHYRLGGIFSYRDHAEYGSGDVDAWHREIQRSGAKGLITTGKDAVKIRALNPPFEVYETHTEPEILFDGETDLIHLLLKQID